MSGKDIPFAVVDFIPRSVNCGQKQRDLEKKNDPPVVKKASTPSDVQSDVELGHPKRQNPFKDITQCQKRVILGLIVLGIMGFVAVWLWFIYFVLSQDSSSKHKKQL